MISIPTQISFREGSDGSGGFEDEALLCGVEVTEGGRKDFFFFIGIDFGETVSALTWIYIFCTLDLALFLLRGIARKESTDLERRQNE